MFHSIDEEHTLTLIALLTDSPARIFIFFFDCDCVRVQRKREEKKEHNIEFWFTMCIFANSSLCRMEIESLRTSAIIGEVYARCVTNAILFNMATNNKKNVLCMYWILKFFFFRWAVVAIAPIARIHGASGIEHMCIVSNYLDVWNIGDWGVITLRYCSLMSFLFLIAFMWTTIRVWSHTNLNESK